MIVIGVDPGSSSGIAVIETTRRQLLEYDTLGGGLAKWEVTAEWIRERMDRWGVDLAVIQTPITQGKTPRWNKSPVSLAKNAALSGLLAGVCWALCDEVVLLPPMRSIGAKMDAHMFAVAWRFNGRISEHARDAAQIALAGARKWNLERQAQKERAKP